MSGFGDLDGATGYGRRATDRMENRFAEAIGIGYRLLARMTAAGSPWQRVRNDGQERALPDPPLTLPEGAFLLVTLYRRGAWRRDGGYGLRTTGYGQNT
jgi:hypothetical protein